MSLMIHKETDWMSRKQDAYGMIPTFDEQGNRVMISPYAKDNDEEAKESGMIREIKFRAWDKTVAIMNSIVKFDYEEHAIVVKPHDIDKLDWNIETSDLKKNGINERHDFEDNECESNRFILMQFTGLKDKNGVEIYEGDIVCGMLPHRLYTVDSLMRFYMDIQYQNMWNFAFRVLNNNTLEVIGNIYEHQHLLEA